jgi:hypothetical protein
MENKNRLNPSVEHMFKHVMNICTVITLFVVLGYQKQVFAMEEEIDREISVAEKFVHFFPGAISKNSRMKCNTRPGILGLQNKERVLHEKIQTNMQRRALYDL